jgi:kynurenine formamidase
MNGQQSTEQQASIDDPPQDPTVDAIQAMAARCSNRGRWGPEDEWGTVNYITAAKILEAAQLIRRGRVFSLAIPFDEHGPQTGPGRMNPMLAMRSTGTDFVSGSRRNPSGIGAADDMLTLSLQGATHWDALSHIFDHGVMWNGYSAGLVNSFGAQRNGVQHLRDRIVSRGILLDIARWKGAPWLDPGYAITEADLEACRGDEAVAVRPGDIVLVRTGQMGYCQRHGWGSYAGGDAPGLSFFTAEWLYRSQIAGIASDTWGVEVRPNELPRAAQPLHQVMLPHIGLLVGEMFDLEALAEDCADSGCYEFFFVAAPLPITGAVGSPINPQAIT